MAQNVGTLLSSAIRPADSLDQFPVFYANEGKGGFYSVADITTRNAITSSRRELGMRVRVISESKDYELINGITNSDWSEVLNGSLKASSTVSGLVKTDVTEADPIVYTKESVDDLFIPRSGTTVGKPITGDLEVNNFIGFVWIDDDGNSNKFAFEDVVVQITKFNNIGEVISEIALNGGYGIHSFQDFTPNYPTDGSEDLIFPQIKWVKDYVGGVNDNVVHKTGEETIEGVKTFTDKIDFISNFIGNILLAIKNEGSDIFSIDDFGNINCGTIKSGNVEISSTDGLIVIKYMDNIVFKIDQYGYILSQTITSNSFVKSEGLDTEILMADGTVQSIDNLQTSLNYTPENSANKSTSTSDSASSVKFPVWSVILSYFSASRIKTILGISTLSGSNTGDETTSTILTKIGDGSFINQAYLPSYVDDVLEFANLASFPATGEIGKIYISLNDNKQFRWTGSTYVQITNGLIGSTNDVPEGGSNLYFTNARVLATLLSGLSIVTGGEIVSTDSVLIAFGKIQKQINDNVLLSKWTETDELISYATDKSNVYTDRSLVDKGYVDSIVSNGIASGPIQKTVSQIQALITSNNLKVGSTYNITDADVSLYGGTSIFLQAVANNRLSPKGVGLFYNPKFNQADPHNGVWNVFMYPTMNNIVGTFTPNETVTADTGATVTTYLASGFLRFIDGDWTGAVTMEGDTSGATCDIVDQITPSYAIGNKRVWGGKMWLNENGNVGSSIDEFTLDSEWSVIANNPTDYNLVCDPIEYDVENDLIIYRKDKSGQEVRTSKGHIDVLIDNHDLGNPIKYLQWGNHYDYATNKGNEFNVINGGFLNNLNSCGSFRGFTLGQGAIANNFTLGQGAGAYNFTLGQDARARNFTLGQNAGAGNFTLGQAAVAYNFTLGQGAGAYNFTLGQGAGAYNFTLGQGAIANNFTLGQGAIANNFTLGQGAIANNFTLGQDAGAENLTLGQGAGAYNLEFGIGTGLNLQPTGEITQNIQNILIESGNYNVDLSDATFFYESYPKVIRARQDGQGILTFWNNSNVQEVYNITD